MLRTLAVLRAEIAFGSLYRRSNGLDLMQEKNLEKHFPFLKVYIYKRKNMKTFIMILGKAHLIHHFQSHQCESFP